jgi:hypothetical protein
MDTKGDGMDHKKRIGELEDALKQRDDRIAELTRERDAERELVAKMAEQVDDTSAMIDSWIEAFDMEMNDKGEYAWGDSLMTRYDELREKHYALVKDWNRFVPGYNAVVAPRMRNFGRPLAASESQQSDVMKRRKAGQSLRAIADETGLSLRTVRTITEKADGVDRATLARLQRIAPNRVAEAKERSRKRSRDALPRRITTTRKRGADLLKMAKGLR